MCRGDNPMFRLNKQIPILRQSGLLQFGEHLHCLAGVAAAHLTVWAQAAADRRPPATAEYATAIVIRQLDAAHTSRFAAFHAWDR